MSTIIEPSAELKFRPATHADVDALVSRPAHHEEARALGAAHVTHTLTDLRPATYDAILDTAGLDAGRLLAPGGRYVSIADAPLPDVPGATKSYVQEDAAHLAHLVPGAPSVRHLADLPLDWEAHRPDVDSEWVTRPIADSS